MKNFKILITIIFSFSWLFTSFSANAALLDLQDKPMFLSNAATPNLLFEIDNSGSMDWEIMTPTYWHACAYDPNSSGSYNNDTDCGFQVTNGLIRSYGNSNWRYFYYMFNNNDNVYSDNCSNSSSNAVEICDESAELEWRVYSSNFNLVYYNPTSEYKPWSGKCENNSDCEQANFNNASSNPKIGSAGYNIKKNLTNYEYHIWIDDKGYTGDRPLRAASINVNNTPNNKVDLWDSHIGIKFTNSNIQVRKYIYNPNSSGMNPTVQLKATLSGNNICYNALGSQELVRSIFNGDLAYNSTNADGCKTIQQAKNNFANWYTYHRKRSYAAKAAISEVVYNFDGFKYGLTAIQDQDKLFVAIPDENAQNNDDDDDDNGGNNGSNAQKDSLIKALYDYEWKSNGTPLRKGLDTAGKYFRYGLNGKPSPITKACQKNYTILFTDGYWNGSSPGNHIGDNDQDGISKTLADVAKYYYDTDLSSLENIVPTDANDIFSYQRMITYGIAFGVKGNLEDTDNTNVPDSKYDDNGILNWTGNLFGNSNWGNPFSNNQAKIDDLWHASYNSKGKYLNATDPTELATKLAATLSNIASKSSSATAVSKSSGSIHTDSKIFQAKFDSKNWMGTLKAQPIAANGTVNDTAIWNTGCLLTGGECTNPVLDANSNPGKNISNRFIITPSMTNNNSKAIEFKWPTSYTNWKQNGNYPEHFTKFMESAPHSINTSNSSKINTNNSWGKDVFNFLRGNRNKEKQNGGTLRNRDSILGDIIHSAITYVAPPNKRYNSEFENGLYANFALANKNRTPMILAGANDGMLHIFNATDGQEILSYVPSESNLWKNLPDLISQNYNHKYYVDGDIAVNDVYLNDSWKTVAVGALRNGGRGIYALNITDPNNFNAANKNNIYMWEFSAKDDADLGFTYSDISIAKVKWGSSSRWAAIMGNGYNNTTNDGHKSSNGKAALFIVFLDGGQNGSWVENQDYVKIKVDSGSVNSPDGLASPAVIDTNGDLIVDYVYAGDLKGNMWRFNLQDAAAGNWNATKIFKAKHGSKEQAISTKPIVSTHYYGLSKGVVVYFGTGKYLEKNDNNQDNQTTQAFYAIWDDFNIDSPVAKSDLLEQRILSEHNSMFDTDNNGSLDKTIVTRYTSNYPISYDKVYNNSEHKGWYIDLKVYGGNTNNGERNFANPKLRNGRIIFTTMQPQESPCDPSGKSWLMELNALNGGALNTSPFDMNEDGKFDDKDKINIGSNANPNYVVASGRNAEVGIIAEPTIMLTDDKKAEVKILSGTGGMQTILEYTGTQTQGRQNWRQLK